MNRIFDMVELANVLTPRGGRMTQRGWREDRIVLCCGCFDLLHLGHVKHLEAAKALGDVLVVLVTPDRFVNKGPGRPVFNENDRTEMLAALRCVDYVAINKWPNAVEAIKLLCPDIYCKGGEYKEVIPPLVNEKEAIEAVGGKLIFTDTPQTHTTDILERLNADLALHQR